MRAQPPLPAPPSPRRTRRLQTRQAGRPAAARATAGGGGPKSRGPKSQPRATRRPPLASVSPGYPAPCGEFSSHPAFGTPSSTPPSFPREPEAWTRSSTSDAPPLAIEPLGSPHKRRHLRVAWTARGTRPLVPAIVAAPRAARRVAAVRARLPSEGCARRDPQPRTRRQAAARGGGTRRRGPAQCASPSRAHRVSRRSFATRAEARATRSSLGRSGDACAIACGGSGRPG